jgi:hypothetical protein
LSPYAYRKYQQELEDKLKKKGFLGKIATSVADEFINNPNTFWSTQLEDPLNALFIPGVSSGVAEAMTPLKAVIKDIHLGRKVGAMLEKELGPKNYQELLDIIHTARDKGGKGVHGLVEGLQNASAELQTEFKKLWKNKNNPFYTEKSYQAMSIALNKQHIAKKDLLEKVQKNLRYIVNNEGNEEAKRLFRVGKHEEALNLLLKSRGSDYLRKITQDPLESAVATFAALPYKTTVGEAPFWVRDQLYKSINKFAPIKDKVLRDMELEDVLRYLPKDKGLIARPQVAMNNLLGNEQIANILAKPFTEITTDELNLFMKEFSKVVPRDKIVGLFDQAKLPIYGRNPTFLNNPIGFARMNMSKFVYEEAGLDKDFLWPRVNALEAEHRSVKDYQMKFMEALKPLNGEGSILKIKDADLKRYGKFIDTGDYSLLNGTKEMKAMNKVRAIFDEMHGLLPKEDAMLGKPGTGYVKNYLPHILKKLDEKKLLGKFDMELNPSVTLPYLKQRVPGAVADYETNLVKVFDTYNKAIHRFNYRRGIVDALEQKLNTINITPEFKRYIQTDIANYAGRHTDDAFVDFISKGFMKTPIAQWMGVGEETAREKVFEMGYNLLQAGYLTGMGLNFKLPFRNVFQGPPLVIPRTSFKAFTQAHMDLANILTKSGGQESKALISLLEKSEMFKTRIGSMEKMMPDITGFSGTYKTPIQAVSDKAIKVTGFPISERYNVASTLVTGLRDEMHKYGIDSYQTLLKHGSLDKILRNAEKLSLDTQFMYAKQLRPQWANNLLGSHLMQYGTFGLNMGNLALRDLMWSSQREYALKSIMQQSLLAMTLTAGGLAGSGYAAYFAALDPMKQVMLMGEGEAGRAVKGPALKFGVGAAQYGVGSAVGLKRLQGRGKTLMKRSFRPAIVSQTKEAIAFKDPSRMFIYKSYPRRKKRK